MPEEGEGSFLQKTSYLHKKGYRCMYIYYKRKCRYISTRHIKNSLMKCKICIKIVETFATLFLVPYAPADMQTYSIRE